MDDGIQRAANKGIFSGVKITLVGGDGRYDFLGATLADLGGEVWLLRRRAPRDPSLRHGLTAVETLRGTGVLVCPMTPFGPRGRVWSEDTCDSIYLRAEDLGLMGDPGVVFAGSFPPDWPARASHVGCELVTLNDLDEVAVLNSVPSAEGAVMLALERTTVTIKGAKTVVLGFGRTGMTLARTIDGMGGRVWVVARRPEARSRALADGYDAAGFDELEETLSGARFVFNTVPALVLTAAGLSRVHPRAVIVDLASGVGGTDFEAASVLGLRAVLAPGLPGRVAPETAARCQEGVIVRTIMARLQERGRAL